MRGNQFKAEYQAVRAGINRKGANRYQDYKHKACTHYELHGSNVPFDTISTDDYVRCVGMFTNPKYLVSIQLTILYTIFFKKKKIV